MTNAAHQDKQELKWSPCRGILDSKCNYLTSCGRICNKCGNVHDGKPNAQLFPGVPNKTIEVTDEMVTRFLGWKLPSDFQPDCGISFKRTRNEHMPFGPQDNEPIGTNLFTARQARAMLEHVLGADREGE